MKRLFLAYGVLLAIREVYPGQSKEMLLDLLHFICHKRKSKLR